MKLLPPAVRIRLLKRLDVLVGKACAVLLPSPVYRPVSQIRTILMIRPGGMGDALLLAPTLASLRRHYPDASITVLAEARNGGVFSLIPSVDKLLLYDRKADLLRLLALSFDLIIDSEQWHRLSAVIARVVRSPIKIGFDTNERRRLFTHPVPYSQADYEALSFLNLLKPIGIDESFPQDSRFLAVKEDAAKEASRLLQPISSPFVTIFPGASIMERRWGADKFRALLLRLAASGISSVIIGGKEDAPAGDEIVVDTNGLNLCGKTSIAGTAALIARSSLLVSGDSGVLHIGVGLGVPTVSLFGAGIALKWAPKGEQHLVINRNLACSPCTLFGTTPPCPNDMRCLKEISVEQVFASVRQLLSHHRHQEQK